MTKKSASSTQSFSKFFWLGVIAVLALFALTHFSRLGTFPVFADESIYIRWAQLLIDDWKQYLFFALNDGKTPLFIWAVAVFQRVVPDQLVAARIVSTAAGVVQMGVVALVLRELGARKPTQLLGMLLVCILPFWFTYHYFAMMDGWLTAWLSLSFWASIKAANSSSKKLWSWTALSGFFFGLALWTKLPAIFYLPIFAVVPFFAKNLPLRSVKKENFVFTAVKTWLPAGVAAGIGLAMFASLKISPAFGQLFSRGQDFTFTIPELLDGKWVEFFANFWKFSGYYLQYLTLPILVIVAAGLFSKTARKQVGLLLVCTFLFLAPFLILGRVVYPRYLLPSVFFFTLAAAVSLEALWVRCQTQVSKNVLWAGIALVIAVFAGQSLTISSHFISMFLFAPNQTPFVALDRVQYLEEWSSGHGIRESVSLINKLMETQSVAVATEGRFGTLPDALLLFFHGKDVSRLYIEGIGQYPVKSLPDFFTNRAKDFDRSLLIVNSHRMELTLPDEKLLEEFCRPNNAPCLQVWDVTELVQTASNSAQPQ